MFIYLVLSFFRSSFLPSFLSFFLSFFLSLQMWRRLSPYNKTEEWNSTIDIRSSWSFILKKMHVHLVHMCVLACLYSGCSYFRNPLTYQLRKIVQSLKILYRGHQECLYVNRWYLMTPCLIFQQIRHLLRLQRKRNRTVMPLYQQTKEISRWNTALISCAAQAWEQEQKITCSNLCQYRYCLIIQNVQNSCTCPVPWEQD